jgi:hypothetical protein
MTPKERLIRLVDDSARALGTQRALARYLEASEQQVCNWRKGRSMPNPIDVVKMQDLLKRAACVLLTALALDYAPRTEAAPTGEKLNSLHIVQHLRRRSTDKQLRKLLDNANRLLARYVQKLNLSGQARDVAIAYLASTAVPDEPTKIAQLAERIHAKAYRKTERRKLLATVQHTRNATYPATMTPLK